MKAEEFERSYLKRLWQWQKAQWQNYLHGACHDLSEIDAGTFELLGRSRKAVEFTGRKREIFRAIVHRGLVDKHPDVCAFRNRLDDRSNYSEGLSVEEQSLAPSFRPTVAKRMRPDVLQLQEVRDSLARGQGYPSYVDLVLTTEGIERDRLLHFLSRFAEENLPAVRGLTDRYGISWSTWFHDLDRIGQVAEPAEPGVFMERLINELGFARMKESVRILEKPVGIAGFACAVSVPDDIRILLGSLRSLRSLLTLFHELGHAAAHSYNSTEGLFKTWTAVHDESMAVVVEQAAVHILLGGADRQAASDICMLENVRCALSALFELSMHERPQKAEKLYLEQYGMLGLDIPDPVVWAADSFRSIDPVYVHNYVLGAALAEKTVGLLQREYGGDFPAWGSWLVKNYFADGRKRTLWEKTAAVGFRV